MDQIFTLAVARNATTAVSGPSEEVDEQVPGNDKDDIEEVWDVSDLHGSGECGMSALRRVKCFASLFHSLCRPRLSKRNNGLKRQSGLLLTVSD